MRIAVFGATGTTGSAVADKLLDRGHDVRAIVRDPSKATDLADRGAQLCVCDVNDEADVFTAVSGADGVYYCSPMAAGYDRPFDVEREWAGHLVNAAKSAGVKHVVFLSALGPETAPGVVLVETKRAAERALAESGVPFTVLRPGMFMDNLAVLPPDVLRSVGLAWPFAADAELQPIAAADIAEIAVRALESGPTNRAWDLVGPEPLTMPAMAATLGNALGFDIGYTDIDDEVFAEQVGPLMGSADIALAVAGAYRQWQRDGSGLGDAAALEAEFDVALTSFADFCASLAARNS